MRRKTTLLAGVIAVVLAIPAVVFASHQFTDVPDSNIFHDDIVWMADNGITRGCGGDEFCPEDEVTREQMAAFMRRFHATFIEPFEGISSAVGIGVSERQVNDPPSTGNGVVDGLSMNLSIPAAGVLVVTASLDMFNAEDIDAFNCGINTGGDVTLAQGDSWRVVDLTANFADTCSTQTAFAASPGDQVVRVVIADAEATTEAYSGVIQAVLYTGDGVFGLLEADEQIPSRQLSDAPKS